MTNDEYIAIARQYLRYDEESGNLLWIKRFGKKVRVGAAAGADDGKGYLQVQFMGRNHRAHRLCWALKYGNFPVGEIDHIDCNGKNNKAMNLREVSRKVNAQNFRSATKANRSTGILGAYRHKGKFMSRITIGGKSAYLGLFDTPEAAHVAYVEAKRAHHPGCTL